jgi:ribonuclease HIII
MNQNNPTYQELQLQRTTTLIRNWSAHISGDKEIQEAFSLDYLSANLVEQIQRINRLKLSNDKVEEILLNYSSLFEKNKYNLVCSTIRGAEPASLLSLFNNCIDTIQWSLEKEEEPDFEFEIHDQLTDCLVKRDDLFLIENYVRRFLIDFDKEEHKIVQVLFNQFIETLSKIDKDFNENIEVFSLTEKFCHEYTKANNLLDEEVYWWLYNPIHKAEEIGTISLLSLRSFFSDKKVSDDITDIAANINANVQFNRLLLDEKNKQKEQHSNIFQMPETPAGKVIETQEVYKYLLAAKSKIETDLRKSIYVLVINKKTGKAETHQLVGSIKIDQGDLNNLDPETKKTIELIPKVAKGCHNISIHKFSIDLQTTPEGCSGYSLGLPAYFEYLNKVGQLMITRPIAATGTLQLDGKITRVDEVNAKVQCALDKGFELVLIPRENEADLDANLKTNPAIRFVDDIIDAVKQIQFVEQPNHPAIESLLRLTPLLKENNIDVSKIELDEKGWNYFIKVAGYGEEQRIAVYFNAKNQIKTPRIIGNPNTILYNLLTNVINYPDKNKSQRIIFNLFAKGKILSEEKAKRLQEFLKANFNNYLQEIGEEGCVYRFDIIKNDKIIIKQYSTGTITVIGQTGSAWDEIFESVELILEQKLEVTSQEKKNNSETVKEDILPTNVTSWIGVDEAGKGDYFGPLVTAAVLVDNSNKSKLSSIGIKDSKNLTDQKNIEMGMIIEKICGDKCYILATMPEKYNEFIASSSFKGNSQRILGWQHRRSIENILSKYECQYAICDQFGDESFINDGLKTGKGSQINIIQRPKAESNLAVAAASILARREFLLRLQMMSEEYQVSFPKGASDTKTIVSVAETLIKKFGKDILNKVAKTHFKTTKMIMDTISKK